MALKSYEELIKVDVRQYCEERDGFTYLKPSSFPVKFINHHRTFS